MYRQTEKRAEESICVVHKCTRRRDKIHVNNFHDDIPVYYNTYIHAYMCMHFDDQQICSTLIREFQFLNDKKNQK